MTPSNDEIKEKDHFRLSQLQKVRESFMQHPKTMRQVAKELFEERENICRYVGMLKDRDQIEVVYRAPCLVTGLTVNYYSTDSSLFKPNNQLKLFDNK